MLVESAELLQFLLQENAVFAFLGMHFVQPLPEFTELVVQGSQQEIQGRLVPAGEGVVLLMEYPVCSGLEMLFDMAPVLRKNKVPFFELLAHGGTGALEGGIVHIQIAAFADERPVFSLQALQLFGLGLAFLLEPLQAQVEHKHFALPILPGKEEEQRTEGEAACKTKQDRDRLQLNGKLAQCFEKRQGRRAREEVASTPGKQGAQGIQFIEQFQY